MAQDSMLDYHISKTAGGREIAAEMGGKVQQQAVFQTVE